MTMGASTGYQLADYLDQHARTDRYEQLPRTVSGPPPHTATSSPSKNWSSTCTHCTRPTTALPTTPPPMSPLAA